MIEATRHGPARRRSPRLLALVALLLVAARTAPAAVPPELHGLAAALADSIGASVSRERVTVLAVREGRVAIDRGSAQGLRPYSRVTLVAADGTAWPATIAELGETRAELEPAAGAGAPPAAGVAMGLRLDLERVALGRPALAGDGARTAETDWFESLAAAIAARTGLQVVAMPDYPDTAEWREAALAAGADAGIRITLALDDGRAVATAMPTGLRRGRDFGRLAASVPARPATAIARMSPAERIPAPPGLLPAAATAPIDGAILDLVPRRWLWSDVLAISDDRIEAWNVAGDPRPVARTDLSAIWPPAVPARWPVAEMIPVNTFFDMSGEEARVNYSLCSNRRPRYLTINVERAKPESLVLVVSDGPLDTLEASLGGCFRELDRVSPPAGWKVDRAMPATAVARLALEEILRDAAGRPLRTTAGSLRRKKVGLVLHDESTGTLWLSTATNAVALPGTFGGEMDDYRAGLAGPPGFLVTGAAAPGEPDHLEWWVLENGRCERRWVGPELTGSITALLSGDRDGDERDDLVYAVVGPGPDGPVTRLHAAHSRPRRGVAP
jgi:hypothetical protein